MSGQARAVVLRRAHGLEPPKSDDVDDFPICRGGPAVRPPRSAPAAELPVEDLDVEVLVQPGSSTGEKGLDRCSRWRLERKRDSDRRPVVGCE